MISSIVFIILQLTSIVNTNALSFFWKVYVPICIIEVVIYFKLLFKWGDKDECN